MILNKRFDYIDFQDDCFTFNKERVKKLCFEMIKQKFVFKWGCATRITLIDKKLLKIMKKAGCENIRFGIESGSKKIRCMTGKSIDYNLLDKNLKMVKKEGIRCVGFFILGLPKEKKKDIKMTLSIIKKLDLDYIEVGLPLPIAGSDLFKMMIKDGKVKKSYWKDICHGKRQIEYYISNNLSFNYLKSMQNKAYLTFYFRPKIIISNLLEIRSLKDLILKFSIAYEILKNN